MEPLVPASLAILALLIPYLYCTVYRPRTSYSALHADPDEKSSSKKERGREDGNQGALQGRTVLVPVHSVPLPADPR